MHLQPGTSYEIKLSVNSGITQTFEASTWPDKRPVGQIIEPPAIPHRTLWTTECSARMAIFSICRPRAKLR